MSLWRRNAEPRPVQPPADPDVTEVHTDWQNMLHRHQQAQLPPTPFSPPTPQPTDDGIRHGSRPEPTAPQRQFQPPLPNNSNDQTAYLPRIPNVQDQYRDSTDIGAQLHLTQQQMLQQSRRVLEYYGNPQIKNILAVVGIQVHGSSAYGVEITENGPTLQRTIIPWHRIHALRAAPGDPILHARS